MFFEHEWFICLNKHSKFSQSSKFSKKIFLWPQNVILEGEKKKMECSHDIPQKKKSDRFRF